MKFAFWRSSGRSRLVRNILFLKGHRLEVGFLQTRCCCISAEKQILNLLVNYKESTCFFVLMSGSYPGQTEEQ